MKNMCELTELIENWGLDRGIIQNGGPHAQAVKTLEEVTELFDALSRDNCGDIEDSLGDIYVTLVMVARTYGVDMTKCVNKAYDEIKDRKGYLRPDGIFVKEQK